MPEAFTQNSVVYRDGKRRVGAQSRLRQLEGAVADLSFRRGIDRIVAALISAGELECALADAGSADAPFAAVVTDRLAELACQADEGSKAALPISETLGLLGRIRSEGELTVSTPEGFAYYALHPLDFADAVLAARFDAPSALVIGIRSIGSTLSAVAAAKLNALSIPTRRTTVRPYGHPYDRQTALTAAQREMVRVALSNSSTIVVCDEGPGRSGSSLLSVAEALEGDGVRREHIVLLCSHKPDVQSLCAPRAAERWGRFKSIAAGLTRRLPAAAARYIGGGEWRSVFFPQNCSWPAVWPNMERLKFLSPEGETLMKFEGHGSYGQQVRERHEMLAASGFSEAYVGQESGFGMHQVVNGSYPQLVDISAALLRHFAKYCAWRMTAFASTVSECEPGELERMASINLEQAMGFAPELRLELARPVICDGRMQPYKWVTAGEDHWLKLDAATHGDDHFFPGPADIAWDLAGLCVEWELDPEARDFLLTEYARITGDNAAPRLPAYELAYAAFRLGWAHMGAVSTAGSPDEHRLHQQATRYRTTLSRLDRSQVAAEPHLL